MLLCANTWSRKCSMCSCSHRSAIAATCARPAPGQLTAAVGSSVGIAAVSHEELLAYSCGRDYPQGSQPQAAALTVLAGLGAVHFPSSPTPSSFFKSFSGMSADFPARRTRVVSVRCYWNGLLHPDRGRAFLSTVEEVDCLPAVVLAVEHVVLLGEGSALSRGGSWKAQGKRQCPSHEGGGKRKANSVCLSATKAVETQGRRWKRRGWKHKEGGGNEGGGNTTKAVETHGTFGVSQPRRRWKRKAKVRSHLHAAAGVLQLLAHLRDNVPRVLGLRLPD